MARRTCVDWRAEKRIFGHPRTFNLVAPRLLPISAYHAGSKKREKDEGRKFSQPNSWNTNARTIRDLLLPLCTPLTTKTPGKVGHKKSWNRERRIRSWSPKYFHSLPMRSMICNFVTFVFLFERYFMYSVIQQNGEVDSSVKSIGYK